jgi:tRNA-specific adenosine deaminase 1
VECTSLLRTPASSLINPSNAFLKAFVVPKSEYHEEGFRRAFSDQGRMKALKGRTWEGGYRFQPFVIMTTDVDFGFSEGDKAGNISAVWSASPSTLDASSCVRAEDGEGLNESIINGIKQGWNIRRVIDASENAPRGASGICRRSMWEMGREVVRLLDEGDEEADMMNQVFGMEKYEDLKESPLAERRTIVKRDVQGVLAPKGWVRNLGDEGWGLEGG